MTRSTPILYLDHSVVSREQSWPPMGEILASGKLRLALSLWNLFEIGSANDKLQRDRRLLFLEQFDPQWIRERVDVQRQEVRCFLWEKHFGVCPEQRPVLTPHLSVVDSYSAVPKARIGLTPRQWIDGVNFSRFEPAKERALDALKDLQTVDKKTFRKRQHEIFRPWIGKLIPTTDPEGKTLSTRQRTELLDFCEVHRDAFFATCKAIAVEDALTGPRIADDKRKPQRSDAIDLMHSVMALAYCDYFLVVDRFAYSCAVHASKALKHAKLATIYRDPQKLRDDLIKS